MTLSPQRVALAASVAGTLAAVAGAVVLHLSVTRALGLAGEPAADHGPARTLPGPGGAADVEVLELPGLHCDFGDCSPDRGGMLVAVEDLAEL